MAENTLEIMALLRVIDESPGFIETKDSEDLIDALRKAFVLDPVKKKNFIRVLTQDNCIDRHGVLEPGALEKGCPLDNGKHDDEEQQRLSTSASLFDKLPLEILRQIFVDELDLQSLTVLRSTCSRLRSSIDLLPEYNELIVHAPNSIRAALSLELAASMTCRALHDAFCIPDCAVCDDFGAYLYLPTCQRVCRLCFYERIEFLPVSASHFKAFWNIDSADMATAGVTIAKTVPGSYCELYKRKTTKRIALVHGTTAMEVVNKVHPTLEAASRVRREKLANWREQLADWDRTPRDQRSNGIPRRPANVYSAIDRLIFNPHRFMCIVGFPWLDKSSGRVDWGVACKACFQHWRSLPDRRHHIARHQVAGPVSTQWKNAQTLHRQDEYFYHFVDCQHARDLYKERFKELNGAEVFIPAREVCDIAGDRTSIDPDLSDLNLMAHCKANRIRLTGSNKRTVLEVHWFGGCD